MNNSMENDSATEYQVFTKNQGMFGLVMIALFCVLIGVQVFGERGDSFTFEELFVLFAFGVPLLVSFVLVMKNIQSGLRSVRIDGNVVTLVYPQDMLQFGESQIFDLKTRRRKDDGKMKGSIRFQGSDGKNYAFRITLEKAGGTHVFEWFERLDNLRKEQQA